jgi:peptidyl-prolyl cis-trans isomerase SurA
MRFLFSGLLAALFVGPLFADGFKAGTASHVITPSEPLWMAGYANRNKPCDTKRHDLWVKALALEDPAGHRCVLMTSDLCGIPRSLSEPVCAGVMKQTGLKREQIMLTRLREREVDDKIQVSDSEIDLFLEAMKAAPGERTEYNISHILVRVPEQASPEQVDAARRRVEQALSQARAGGDFAQIAATYSNAPEALQGGALGWRAHDRLPELFADALEKLRPGEITPPLRSPAGFHLLKLVDRRVGGMSDAPIPQTRVRHILIRTSEAVSETEARRRLSDLRRRILAKEADFGEMARVHSDDASSARGGELDWIYPGDTVPDFERAYQELQVGEISEPVRTQFGVHLIQVLERRSADMSTERKRLQARQVLRERKGDEAYTEWLRQLRDQSYVELRLEER